MQEGSPSVIGIRAPVAPRAHRPGCAARPTLEQLVRPFVENRACGAIYIVCPAGFGKTTALSHLRAVLPGDASVGYFDEPQYEHWESATDEILALVATTKLLPYPALATFELAEWTDDDCLEYLAHVHRQKCAAVMKRLVADPLYANLKGSPMHLGIVMDEMAADDSVDLAQALLRYIDRNLPYSLNREALGMHAAGTLTGGQEISMATLTNLGVSEPMRRFCAPTSVSLVLGAQWAANVLRGGKAPHVLQSHLKYEAIYAIGQAIRPHPAAISILESLLGGFSEWGKPMAASILLAAKPSWCPASIRSWNLRKAKLHGAQWSGLAMNRAHLTDADLGSADLSRADMTKAKAERAILSGANLGNARLYKASFEFADLSNADLSGIHGSRARFDNAVLVGTSFVTASLQAAVFASADLRNADFTNADLSRADLSYAVLDGAIFEGAKLNKAELWMLKLYLANWRNASFPGARIRKCDLGGMELPEADFTGADLSESDLTGTQISGGKFAGARLVSTGLAEIEWENADLRGADFTHASFHLGSTRSGLVGSTIACEGSRTGFYTDDYNEQDFKAPEEIRKANLRGADLRGAKVFGTDWYLVDLRDAKYTPDQAAHFIRCGAILFHRAR